MAKKGVWKMREEIKILTPAGMLGYGYPIDLFKKGSHDEAAKDCYKYLMKCNWNRGS